jgi:uncharacterized phage protein gp47/JayE
LRTIDYGVTRKAAIKAQRKGLFFGPNGMPLDIPLNTRFLIRQVNYKAIEQIATGQFIMECEIAGTVGNQNFGDLLPIDYISGLSRAELSDILIPGADVESDEELRQRYLQHVQRPATSGNEAQYRQWAVEVSGVGDAKVFPLWSGPGTVKIAIVDTEKKPASSVLLDAVSDYIETVRPIGASVTVVSAVAKEITISATVTLATGYTLQGVINAFSSTLEAYMRDAAFAVTYVSYAKVGTLLLGTPGVIDYQELSLNGGTANVILADEEIPVLGTVDLGV